MLSFYYNLLRESFSQYFSRGNLSYCFLNVYIYLYISYTV